jgi:hypothetical protein
MDCKEYNFCSDMLEKAYLKEKASIVEKSKDEKWNTASLDKILRLTLEKFVAKDKAKIKERQAEASIKKIQRLEKTQDRRDDTRRKIIIGALVLAEQGWKKGLDQLLELKLVKPADRVLFNLPLKCNE